ncbi:MAG: NAD(+) diphosphatase [Chloroflexi bacterium]|nr:NAD(+) diphosphatase [Chloroflexota bacterium]MBV9545349.1 NAD(+) diphosphatase [Chloroflexota bacterium]
MESRRTLFISGLRPPTESQPAGTTWFAFRGDRLLVRPQGDTTALPDYAELAQLGADFEAGHYLGRLGDLDCYAVNLPEDLEPPEGLALDGLRALFGRLSEDEYAIAGRAAQILVWDQTHRFCGRCGAPTVNAPAERAKLCPQCGLLSFPRLSPAVIMLIQRGEDEFLLARNRAFADGFFSVLAGFVEPGESLEEAVSREVHEEVGLQIDDIRYFGSQPWPFPHQLMIGFTAQYTGGEIRPQDDEIAEAAWFSRRGELPKLPGKLSIARRLIDAFLARA